MLQRLQWLPREISDPNSSTDQPEQSVYNRKYEVRYCLMTLNELRHLST
jgi:hypothetical protein